MKLKSLVFGAVAGLFCACEDGLQLPDFQLRDTSNLSINVITEQAESKGLITDTYLPSGSAIGVTVLNTSGGNYDGTAYSNIKFTSSGTGTSQTWSGASTVKLSATEGYCYAYYPYSSSASSITAIPVSAGGTDYLYATKQSVNDKSYSVTLPMKHALAAIRFALKRGTYAGTGKVTGVSASSAALGSSGTLDATTGAVTASNKGAAVSQSASLTLSTTAQNVDVVMVPSGTAGSITLSVTIDGKAYSTTVSSTTIAQGNCYTYTLTVNAGALALSGVKVGAWGYNSVGYPTITAAGYTVTIAGNYSDIAFGNSVSGNTVTIKAVNYEGIGIYPVSISSGATLSQTVSGNTRIISLSNITSNVTVTFKGLLYDGVYAIDNAGNLVDYTTAYAASSGTYKGVAIVIKGKPYEIAKTEASTGTAWNSSSFSSTQQTIFSPYYFTYVDGTNEYGYLMDPSGSYADVPEISSNAFTWLLGALSDMNGYLNTQRIKSAGVTIASVITAFNNGSNNQGSTSWYLPSAGQLAYTYINYEKINNLMGKVYGSALSTSGRYWSSSVNSDNTIYVMLFIFGLVGPTTGTVKENMVRLFQDL